MLQGKRILLIVSGGIAAFKSIELIRRLREGGASVRCVLTRASMQFVTPLSVSAVSEDKVYEDLFSLTDEAEMGHIRLSREADLVVVAPATANILAKMAAGIGDDLATTVLLATDKDVIAVPAMNVRMWTHPATRNNVRCLESRGVRFAGPAEGAMACGEFGPGRMIEPEEIVTEITRYFSHSQALSGCRAIVTSGPTIEAIDPVRFISNHSSGKQGHAIAAALAELGAETILVSGPCSEPDPEGVEIVRIESARDMLDACVSALPADVAICAAAVADWRPADIPPQKIKKTEPGTPQELALIENPDILATLARADNQRPRLVIGFAAETENVVDNAIAKRNRKMADWILANDVSPSAGTFGSNVNRIHLVTANGVEDWPVMTKTEIARQLAGRISETLAGTASS